MTKWIILLALGLSVPATGIFASETKTPEETKAALEEVRRGAESITAFKAHMTTKVQILGQEMVISGRMSVLKPDKMRMQMQTALPDSLSAITVSAMTLMSTEIVADGSQVWIFMPQMNTVQKMDLEFYGKSGAGTGQQTSDPSKPFDQLDPDSLALIGEETILEVPCYIFQGDAAEKTKSLASTLMAPQSIKVWVAKADGIARKMEAYNSNDRVILSSEFTDVETDVKLDPEDFVFEPPSGVSIVDFSQTMEKTQMMMQFLERMLPE